MRRISKFKFSNKKHNYPHFFYNRILHFQRPKWKFIKTKILRLKKTRKSITIKIIFKKKVKLFRNMIFLKEKIKQQFLYSKYFFFFFKKVKKILKKKNISFLKFKLKKFINKKQKSVNKKQVEFILNNFFFNFVRIKSKISSWNRLRFTFKENLWMKFSVFKYFNFCFSTAFFKRFSFKKKSRVYNLSLAFVQPEYRLDILLWRLKFFLSPYTARNAIRFCLVDIYSKLSVFNTKVPSSTYFVQPGDIIQVTASNLVFKKVLSHFAKAIYLPSFLEVDYYTNTIVILKSFKTLKEEDLNSIIKEPLCFYKFKNFILK
jgi:hypothetical protein